MQTEHPRAAPQPFALFPVVIQPAGVFTYVIKQSGSALSRESEDNIAPGDYGIYNEGKNRHVQKSMSKLKIIALRQMARGRVWIIYSLQHHFHIHLWVHLLRIIVLRLLKK